MATQDAYARVSAIAPVNAVIPVPAPTPEKAVMPFMDPAFAVSVCRYDLSRGPLKFSVPISPAYTSVSFYTRSDVPYYAINDRAAGRRVIELDLMTAAQRAELPENEDITRGGPIDRGVADDHRPDRDQGAGARTGMGAWREKRARGGAVPPQCRSPGITDLLSRPARASRAEAGPARRPQRRNRAASPGRSPQSAFART